MYYSYIIYTCMYVYIYIYYIYYIYTLLVYKNIPDLPFQLLQACHSPGLQGVCFPPAKIKKRTPPQKLIPEIR